MLLDCYLQSHLPGSSSGRATCEILQRRQGETQSIPCRQLHTLGMSPSSGTNWMLSGVQRFFARFAIGNVLAGICFPSQGSSIVVQSGSNTGGGSCPTAGHAAQASDACYNSDVCDELFQQATGSSRRGSYRGH